MKKESKVEMMICLFALLSEGQKGVNLQTLTGCAVEHV